MKRLIGLLLIPIIGCVGGPTPKLDLSGYKDGASMTEIKESLAATPVSKKMPTPLQMVCTVALQRLEKKYIKAHDSALALFSQEGVHKSPEETWAILSDNARIEKTITSLKEVIAAEDEGWTVWFYTIDRSPYYFIFDNNHALIARGEGDGETVALIWQLKVLGVKRTLGMLSNKQTEEQAAALLREYNGSSPIFEEYLAYRIMLASQIDKKKITEEEFDYLTAKKEAEIINQAQNQARQARASESAQIRARAYMMMGQQLGQGIKSAFKSFGGAAADSLGNYSANPYAPESTANPYGAGNPYNPNSINNPYGTYGSPYSPKSATNPYATDAPRLYDSQGNYRGKLSNNPYDPDSVSNPYGRYGSPYSPDSSNNPYGAGSPFNPDSPTNPYGQGLRIYGE